MAKEKLIHSKFKRVLAALLTLVLLYVGVTLSQSGFRNIQQFKQLERIPPSSILSLVDGEAHINAVVRQMPGKKLLTSPSTKRSSIYFRYLEEREETDSDGDTRWVTVQDYSKSVDFLMLDEAVSAQVIVSGSHNNIRWSMPESYSKRVGDRRYTEWRIEPKDNLFIFGWATVSSTNDSIPRIIINFDKEGQYTPIISRYDAEYERGDLGLNAILRVWGGISLLALAVTCLVYAIQIHRVVAYLLFITFVTSTALCYYGFATLLTEVKGGDDRLTKYRSRSENAIQVMLSDQNIPWPGLDDLGDFNSPNYFSLSKLQRRRLTDIRLNLYNSRKLYILQIDRFPENLFAWFLAVANPEPILGLPPQDIKKSDVLFQRFRQTSVHETVGGIWIALGFILFVGLAKLGFHYIRNKRLIENIPTSMSLGVSYGIAEIKGKVVSIDDEVLVGPVTYLSCIWYRYLVEEKRGSGKNTKWVTISDEMKSVRFQCQDQEGRLTVDANNAEIVTSHKEISSSGSMRYTEWTLCPGDPLYAIGQAEVDEQTGDTLYLNKGKSNDLFIVSNYSEKEIMISKAMKGMLSLCAAFSALFLGALFLCGINGNFSATDFLMSGLTGPLFLIVFMFILHYNDLIFHGY